MIGNILVDETNMHNWMGTDILSSTWCKWRWQMANRITSLEQLQCAVPSWKANLAELEECTRHLRFAVTPYYLELMLKNGIGGALWQQVVPAPQELDYKNYLSWDPLGEKRDSPTPCVIHRYTNRVVLLLTNRCATYCRFCNRRRRAAGEEADTLVYEINDGIEYLEAHPEVQEVILSGGDPLCWEYERLPRLLTKLRQKTAVELIRINTRMAAVLPFRITEALLHFLKPHLPIYVNLHVNHPAEVTEEFAAACDRLTSIGIPLGSQTVLLKGINDDVEVLRELMHRLLRVRVKPYALYQTDPVQGTAHFRTSLTKGRELLEGLLAQASGLEIPHYIVDAPEGGGKVPLLPDFVKGDFRGGVVLQTLKGEEVKYYDGSEH